MIDKQFDKETFKKSVKDNVKFLYRRKLEEATQEQLFQAVSYTVKDVIIDNWLDTQNAYEKQDPKIVYYKMCIRDSPGKVEVDCSEISLVYIVVEGPYRTCLLYTSYFSVSL